MNEFMHQIFGLVCSQNPAHTWTPGGGLLPVCQRCTGLYVSAALALYLLLRFRPSTDTRYRRLHAIFLLLMTPFGFHLVPHGAVLRTMSGYWFGFGVVGLLWLMPGAWVSGRSGPIALSLKHYLFWGAAGLVVLPFITIFGGVSAALILSWLALVGMGAMVGLLVANFVLFIGITLAWIRRRAARATL